MIPIQLHLGIGEINAIFCCFVPWETEDSFQIRAGYGAFGGNAGHLLEANNFALELLGRVGWESALANLRPQ